MADPIKVLTRENSLTKNTSPTGQKYKIEIVPDTSMFRISQDGGVGGKLPMELLGHYTSSARAQTTLTKFLIKFWNESDTATRAKKVA